MSYLFVHFFVAIPEIENRFLTLSPSHPLNFCT